MSAGKKPQPPETPARANRSQVWRQAARNRADCLPDARQVSWLADHRTGAPSRLRLEPVALCAGTTAYSCGDSSGIEQRARTGFPSPDLAGDPKILCSWGAVTTICCDMEGCASSCFWLW